MTTSRTPLGSAMLAGVAAIALLAATLGAAPAAAGVARADASAAARGTGEYRVAAGVTSVTFHVVGAYARSTFGCDNVGGWGGEVTATISVAPGEVLQYNVGNSYDVNLNSFNSSDVRRAPYGLSDRVIVAGGGGYAADGAGQSSPGVCNGDRSGPGIGGAGGNRIAETGHGEVGCSYPGGNGGGGGTQSEGGGGGAVCGAGASGTPGTFGAGGLSGVVGGPKAPCSSGGGGGFGWYGGGGGATTMSSDPNTQGGCTDASGNPIAPTAGGGGGGGSSYAEPGATNVVMHAGVNRDYFGSVSVVTQTAPTVTGVSPKAGPLAGGRTVTITGAHLTGTSSVTFGGTAATHVVVASSTKLTARAPAHAAGGVHVRVTTAAGTSPAVPADRYTYLKKPVVASISPPSGSKGGGQTVTVVGSHLRTAFRVFFGSAKGLKLKILSDSKVIVRSPAHSRGAVDVRVRTLGGLSTKVKADRYTYR